MKALVFTNTEELSYQNTSSPVVKDDEELIKVVASGICGSDMHAYHGYDDRRTPPLILGHEISGLIDGTNKAVVINPLVTCHQCEECQSNREHLCQNRGLIGMSKPKERNGGFAEYVSVPKNNLYLVKDQSKLNNFSITEPAAVSYHAIQIAIQHSIKSLEKSKILIIGGGAIGLLTALILNQMKITNYIIIDTNSKRLDVCKKAAQCYVAHPEDKSVAINNYDIVIDAVGFEKTRQKSIQSVKQGGLIVHIGLSQPAGEFDFRKATLQEIIFVGTYCYTDDDFKNTLNLIEEKKLGNLEWLDFRPLSDGNNAFKEIHEGTTASPKIILLP